jgi:hypothetical protein
VDYQVSVLEVWCEQVMGLVVCESVYGVGCVFKCLWGWLCVKVFMGLVVCESVYGNGCVWKCLWGWLCVKVLELRFNLWKCFGRNSLLFSTLFYL